jgi:hypothetical protein
VAQLETRTKNPDLEIVSLLMELRLLTIKILVWNRIIGD